MHKNQAYVTRKRNYKQNWLCYYDIYLRPQAVINFDGFSRLRIYTLIQV